MSPQGRAGSSHGNVRSRDAGLLRARQRANRLIAPKGVLEFEHTKEILQRRMPPAPATVGDIGGGPGLYSLWLAELGYRVQHRDLMELHVDQLSAIGNPAVKTAVGDARQLDLSDESVDAVRLLGPL